MIVVTVESRRHIMRVGAEIALEVDGEHFCNHVGSILDVLKKTWWQSEWMERCCVESVDQLFVNG